MSGRRENTLKAPPPPEELPPAVTEPEDDDELELLLDELDDVLPDELLEDDELEPEELLPSMSVVRPDTAEATSTTEGMAELK